MRRHVDERHRVALDEPAVARVRGRGIENRKDAAVRIENRGGGARQCQVVPAEMLFSMHCDGPRLGEARADAVGALMALTPERAQRQSGVSELALQRRVGDGAQHSPLRIGEDHRKARAGDLLVQALHLGACDGQELAQALLQLFHGLRIEHADLARSGRLDTVLPQAPVPRLGYQRLDSRGLQTTLDDLNNSRSMARHQTFVSQGSPFGTRCDPCSLRHFLDIYQRDVAILQCALHSCPWEACAVSLKQAIRTAARVCLELLFPWHPVLPYGFFGAPYLYAGSPS